MALAFKRACGEAEKAMAGYYSQFKDYCGMDDAVPIAFDWDSAKAVEGSSKFNTNNEELPKCVTMAKYFASNPNYVPGLARGVGTKAGAEKQLAWGLQKKHFNKILVHFDEKSTKKGECTWACEVKDGVLHATMQWEFTQYMGRANWEHVSDWIENYLDEKEAWMFEVEKKRVLDDVESGKCSKYFGSDGTKYLTETLGKKVPVDINWDTIRATQGREIQYSNKPPVMVNYLMVVFLNDNRGMLIVRSCVSSILADQMGKEAFGDAFEKVRIDLTNAGAHKLTVKKEGKTLIFDMQVKMSDNQNFSRAVNTKEIAKQIENLL